jgi:hypothetical protein
MIEICIFILPNELPDLERTINTFKLAKDYLQDNQLHRFTVIMGVSNEVVDWENSTTTKEQTIHHFSQIENIIDWTDKVFVVSTEVNGCTTARKYIAYDTKPDFYLWLDTDIVFSEQTFAQMYNAAQLLRQNTEYFVLTPSTVRLWDTTWDCLVAPRFLDKELGYHKLNNPHTDTSYIEHEYVLTEVRNTVPRQPQLKFAGGWFTVLSSPLLERIPIPESFTHYGLEDTYIMWAAQKLNDPNIKQFRFKNLVVCENYFDRQLDNNIILVDRREEYKSHNSNKFMEELRRLV